MTDQNANEIRREAFRAAAVAVDRFLDRVGDPVSGGVGDLGPAARDRFRSELARVVDLNLEMVRNAFGLYGTLLAPDSLERDENATQLNLSPAIAGSEAVGVLWLHNFDPDPITGISLTGSGVANDEGEPIGRPAWSFTPPSVSVPARSAVPVLVTLAIPTGAMPGSYKAEVATAGRPGEPIEVRVEVVALEPVAHDSW